MRFPRSCGILVHPTSFPSKYGMGDLGPEARNFIDLLAGTHQTIWQVLPLSPVGYGNSPYASYSAFAGNPYLISPEILVGKGLLTSEETARAELPESTVADFDNAYRLKDRLYNKASERFFDIHDSRETERYEQFLNDNGFWLDDFALFMVCSELNDYKTWNHWTKGLAQRDRTDLDEIRKKYKREIRHKTWLQYEFYSQWMDLRRYTNSKGIRIVGDIPIFVNHNSADVWANPHYFDVDNQGNRKRVAGVPPDYFSETGQLWGNPVYKWDRLARDDYTWWVERFKMMFTLFDAIRVDHFRGFESYWEVLVSEKTAEKGRWVKAPGEALFRVILDKLGTLPIIAEDLGIITPEVESLRDRFSFPGMKVLQFAFETDAGNNFLPHNYDSNCVVYSGTHDNDTTIGWYKSAPDAERHRLRVYTKSDGSEPNWELIRLAMLSVADQAIFPLQDYMNLDSAYRMNTPGTVGENWKWRYTHEMIEKTDWQRIKKLIEISNR